MNLTLVFFKVIEFGFKNQKQNEWTGLAIEGSIQLFVQNNYNITIGSQFAIKNHHH